MRYLLLIPGIPLIALSVAAQTDSLLLAHDDLRFAPGEVDDPLPALSVYEPLNGALGGDSIRLCNGYACIGWVEDHWPEGGLKHRGYYNNGQLLIYKNYHPDGVLEREFKVIDDLRCQMRTYHGNGALRSEATYFKSRCIKYADFYANGQMRYQEEKHKTEPYYLVMDLYAENGSPISTLHIVDKKKVVFEQKEYHRDGHLRSTGRAQYDPGLMDSKRFGTWTYFDAQGKALYEEHYVEGRMQDRRDL